MPDQNFRAGEVANEIGDDRRRADDADRHGKQQVIRHEIDEIAAIYSFERGARNYRVIRHDDLKMMRC